MSFKHLIELYEILDNKFVTGNDVKQYIEAINTDINVEVQTVEGKSGSTDFVKTIIPGTYGKSSGGNAPTLGVIGRLGGIGARPERKGFVSDGDGALAAVTVAAKLADM